MLAFLETTAVCTTADFQSTSSLSNVYTFLGCTFQLSLHPLSQSYNDNFSNVDIRSRFSGTLNTIAYTCCLVLSTVLCLYCMYILVFASVD